MGIIRPRPGISQAARRMLKTRLRVHAALMAKFEAEDGLTREAASSKAYDIVKFQKRDALAQIADQYELAVSLS